MQSGENSQYSGISELEESSKFLIRYNQFVSNLFSSEFKKFARGIDLNVCEFGAGTGTLTELFNKDTGVKPLCVEVDSELINRLRDNGHVTKDQISLFDLPISFVYSSNVLEHIEDDKSTIADIYKKLEIGGLFLIYVPALNLLFSGLDRQVGHYRRYSKQDLNEKLIESGFIVEKIHYVDSLGFFAALLTKFLGYGGKSGLGGERSLRFYDRYVFPISKVLDKIGVKSLFGKNLFCIARK
jgi:SAM-dependent methyltransferase